MRVATHHRKAKWRLFCRDLHYYVPLGLISIKYVLIPRVLCLGRAIAQADSRRNKEIFSRHPWTVKSQPSPENVCRRSDVRHGLAKENRRREAGLVG